MKNEIIKEDILDIGDMIYEINGKEVMLDSDLAKLYHVETKRINEAVSRNPRKFPIRITWNLNDDDSQRLLVANCDQKIETRGGKYKNPRVFTEQGIYMLATILKSDVAIDVSIRIMDTFVKMRHYINYNQVLLPNRILLLENKVDDNTKRIDELFDRFSPKDIAKEYIFFEGQLYDAYSLLLDIFDKAKNELIIIDNYAGKELLNILKNIDKNIIIVSNNISDVLKKKYSSQYKNVSFINNNSFHDRFIIIDRKTLYTCGASFKDLGKKCFSINLVENNKYLEDILKVIE
jgi:hypothetical protein